MAVVTGGDGCLVLGFSWQEGLVEKGIMEAVMREVEGAIGRIAGGV